jgi:hypothetical protein
VALPCRLSRSPFNLVDAGAFGDFGADRDALLAVADPDHEVAEA